MPPRRTGSRSQSRAARQVARLGVTTRDLRGIIQHLTKVHIESPLDPDVAELKSRVATLEKEVEALRDSILDEVVVLRTISGEQAKQEIRELFQSGETLFYSDVAQRLRLELPLVAELCQELEQEGEIEVSAVAVRQW